MSSSEKLRELIDTRQRLIGTLAVFEVEHEAIINQLDELRSAIDDIDAQIKEAAANGAESEIVYNGVKVKVVWRSPSRTYDPDKLVAAFPEADDIEGLITTVCKVDTKKARDLAKRGVIPMEALEAAMIVGTEPKPTVTIEEVC